jgi:hypothetical protein
MNSRQPSIICQPECHRLEAARLLISIESELISSLADKFRANGEPLVSKLSSPTMILTFDIGREGADSLGSGDSDIEVEPLVDTDLSVKGSRSNSCAGLLSSVSETGLGKDIT